MARTSKKEQKKITIVGQSASGKTNMLASLMFNDNATDDLKHGPHGVINPTCAPEMPDGDAKSHAEDLQKHYKTMLYGKDDPKGEGTNDVRSYFSRLTFTEQADPEPRKGLFGFGAASEPEKVSLDFEIVDGRGGDFAPSVTDDEMDETAKGRRQAYRDALDDSVAKIICMPVQKDAYKSEIAARALNELNLAIKRKAEDSSLPRLERVAICFTKYEAEFMGHGPDAIYRASDPETFRAMMMNHASRSMFSNFVLSNDGPNAFDIQFFPVSAYGFTAEAGGANFYNHSVAPGLKSRAIDPDYDYDDPDMPDYRAHFPHPLTEADATSLWYPFNVAPPFLYALTGLVTGPLCLSPERLGFGLAGAGA